MMRFAFGVHPNRGWLMKTSKTRSSSIFFRADLSFFSLPLSQRMKRTVGCFTDAKLRELAEQPNTVVYQPTHDIVYTPWTASRVRDAVMQISSATREGKSPDDIRTDEELREFSEKYTKFFEKLTDAAFVADEEHVKTMLKLVMLKSMVEQGILDDTTAQAQSADVALKSLASRVPK